MHDCAVNMHVFAVGQQQGAPKKGSIFWPRNGPEKGEGRLSAFTLWGANFRPHCGGHFWAPGPKKPAQSRTTGTAGNVAHATDEGSEKASETRQQKNEV
jgi:hypothetical protein